MTSAKPSVRGRWYEHDYGYTSPCWIWADSITTQGYGVIYVDRGALRAHRVAYEEFVGPIPRGFSVHHLCETRSCVNPEHLRAVSAGLHRKLHTAFK
jgi:hypothetical protein